MKNKYGLSRDIPTEVKLAIRQHAGFGCVICGLAVGQYEHIEPPFAEAHIHDPECMTYLCGSCHDRVTRGIWSKQKVLAARMAPWAVVNGQCHDAFDVGIGNVAIWVGDITCINIHRIIEIDGVTLLELQPPASPRMPYMISAKFFNDNGQLTLEIVENEWRGIRGNWDIECVGQRIFVRSERGRLVLQILAVPGRGIVVERLDFIFNGTKVFGTRSDGLVLTPPNSGGYGIAGRCLIEGFGDDVVLFRCRDGKTQLGGGKGGWTFQVSDDSPPWRRPARNRHPCPCGSALPFRSCCGK